MTQRRVATFALVFLIACSIGPTTALAQKSVLPGQIVPESCNTEKGGCQSICDIAELADNVLDTGIFVAVFLSAVLFAWAGWLYLTSGGGSEITRARAIFTNVAIGLVIILVGWLVVDTLIRTLTGGKLGPWNEICYSEPGFHAGTDK